MWPIKSNISNKKKVFVGVSGGVDSSVSAALLKDQGYDVTGVFIKTWHPVFLPCTWQDEKRDAMRVCAALDIPFMICDAEASYKKEVADYMIEEYKKGRTPNPDVMCNRYVKFGTFYDFAMKHGADYVATGHYARICADANDQEQLSVSIDTDKDQTYFLWTLLPDHIQHILFPIGHLQKSEVRALAKHYKLPTAVKKDSQGLCFIGKVDMKEFLEHYISVTKGDVIDEEGTVIGRHDGAVFYTIGERHGFTIDAHKKSATEKAYYIVKKDIDTNTITVSHTKPDQHPDFGIRAITLEKSLLRGAMNYVGVTLSARLRYRQPYQTCRITAIKNDIIKLEFDSLQQIAAGQSCVLYYNSYCIGGGIIQ